MILIKDLNLKGQQIVFDILYARHRLSEILLVQSSNHFKASSAYDEAYKEFSILIKNEVCFTKWLAEVEDALLNKKYIIQKSKSEETDLSIWREWQRYCEDNPMG